MPNKCTKCGKIHQDDASYLLEDGCDKCGSRFFFYVRQDALKQAEEDIKKLTTKEIEEIEHDIRDIVSEVEKPVEEDETVILDVEAIRVIKPGKYHIDVTKLFMQRPIVIRVGPGRYEIDLTTMMGYFRKKK
jgi:predicted  nucleic acid-binding Zn-ribbon protein